VLYRQPGCAVGAPAAVLIVGLGPNLRDRWQS